MVILRRIEEETIKAMCKVKSIKKSYSPDLMDLLDLEETLASLARASEVRWYEHALRRDVDVLRRASVSDLPTLKIFYF